MTLLYDAFPTEPEELDEIKQTLQENWNTTKHIKNLYNRNKEIQEKLVNMKINNNYTVEEFIKATTWLSSAPDNSTRIVSSGRSSWQHSIILKPCVDHTSVINRPNLMPNKIHCMMLV